MNIIEQKIRSIPDYPKEGIIFKDITPLLQDPAAFKETIDKMAETFKDSGVNVIAGIESRGFIFGAPLAYKLGISFVPIRKKGKLPWKTISESYELEYGVDELEIHEDAIVKGQKVVVIDDLLATGGTIGASANLVKRLGGEVAGICFLIELEFLKAREKLKEYNIHSLISY